jgi:hypothetical protein
VPAGHVAAGARCPRVTSQRSWRARFRLRFWRKRADELAQVLATRARQVNREVNRAAAPPPALACAVEPDR